MRYEPPYYHPSVLAGWLVAMICNCKNFILFLLAWEMNYEVPIARTKILIFRINFFIYKNTTFCTKKNEFIL